MKAVGTYVTREEAEAVRAEMMKRPATPYQDSTLQDCFRMFKESREYKGRSDKARELYDIAWKYLRPLWHFKIAALYAQDFQNILDKMADNGLSQSILKRAVGHTPKSKTLDEVYLHPKANQMIEAFDKAN